GICFQKACTLCSAVAYCCGAVALCAIAALLGRFLPRLGPLAFASGPFFFLGHRIRKTSRGIGESRGSRSRTTRNEIGRSVALFRGGLEWPEIVERHGRKCVGQRGEVGGDLRKARAPFPPPLV